MNIIHRLISLARFENITVSGDEGNYEVDKLGF